MIELTQNIKYKEISNKNVREFIRSDSLLGTTLFKNRNLECISSARGDNSMNVYIKSILAFNKEGEKRHVDLTDGLNVITGNLKVVKVHCLK